MMPKEAAILSAIQHMEWLSLHIELEEQARGIQNKGFRHRFATLRALLFYVGMEPHAIPEAPYLDPAHHQAWLEFDAKRKAERSEAAHEQLP
jgi:hypothetical protein